MAVVYALLAALVLAGAVVAVCAASLVRAALALFIASAALSVIYFLLDAPYAASVQLSVGTGLVGTLFIIAISLTERIQGGGDEG